MSKKKLESKQNKTLELIQRQIEISTPDSRLIKLSLQLTNQFRTVLGTPTSKRKKKKEIEWVKSREQGKSHRKNLCDTLKSFIEYAKMQGSQGADKYYINFTKMQNSAMGCKNRDSADLFTLHAFEMTDKILALSLEKGMENKEPYKQIFQSAKKKVEDFCKSVGMV